MAHEHGEAGIMFRRVEPMYKPPQNELVLDEVSMIMKQPIALRSCLKNASMIMKHPRMSSVSRGVELLCASLRLVPNLARLSCQGASYPQMCLR